MDFWLCDVFKLDLGYYVMLTHLDLCTGIGGFHLGAEWAGFQTIGFAEVEPYCCKLLAQKWPQIKNYGDIRTADFSGLRGRVTVLSAGVPCQPSSLAGKRRGSSDDRWLWPAVLDVVESVRPAWCIFENPPGILSLDEFAGVLLRLADLGYQVRLFSVSANAVGAKHRRQRIFIVGNRNCATLRPECSHGERIHDTEPVMANAYSRRFDRSEKWQDQQPWRAEIISTSEVVADRSCQLLNGCWDTRQGRWHESASGSQALADADRARLEIDQSRQPGQCASTIGSGGLNGSGEPFADFCRKPDAVSQKLDTVNGINGQTEETGSNQILCSLRQRTTSQMDQSAMGRSSDISHAEILRSNVHGSSIYENQSDQRCLQEADSSFTEKDLREVWNRYPSLDPSQRQKLEQQCSREFNDAVLFVSHILASRSGRDISQATKAAMLRLRQAIVQIGAVQHLQDAKAEVWNALPQADKHWTVSAACSSYWAEWWPGLTPLCKRTDGIPDRSHRLKALGNAVVPQQVWPFFAAIAQVETT